MRSGPGDAIEVDSIEKFLARRYVNVAPLSTRFISRLPSSPSRGISRCLFVGSPEISSVHLSVSRRRRVVVARRRNPPGTVQYILRPLAKHEGPGHYSILYFNQLISFRYILISFPLCIGIISPLPLEKRPSRSRRLVPFFATGRSWKHRRKARRKAEEFIAGDMCDATGEMHARTYVRMYVPRASVCACPRTRTAVSNAAEESD